MKFSMMLLAILSVSIGAHLISECSCYIQHPPGPNERPVLIDSDQLAAMKITLNNLILSMTEECKDLNSYLRNTPKSLDWISTTGAKTLLSLAINLDQVFGHDILAMILRE